MIKTFFLKCKVCEAKRQPFAKYTALNMLTEHRIGKKLYRWASRNITCN